MPLPVVYDTFLSEDIGFPSHAYRTRRDRLRMEKNDVSETPAQNPWAPIILSLDGGGVRGLSSLYILREIMREIKRLDNLDTQNRLENDSENELPLPCNYFDFIIGTSTGGLIAIMLGRLRMRVTDCIQQYWVLSNAIFRPSRLRIVQLYSRKKVQDAARKVVKQFCGCRSKAASGCSGNELLRQYDYDEEDTVSSNRRFANKTCRVAVLTVREMGKTSFANIKDRDDMLILFRSYNHRVRHLNDEYERNPKTLENSALRIHEACSATSAAPTYFRPVRLWGRRFIDGGVYANNPSSIAWNEVSYMTQPPHDEMSSRSHIVPHALISIGTGIPKKQSRFGLFSLLHLATKKITETEDTHDFMKQMLSRDSYFRFNVPNHPRIGLAEIKLSDCKKEHIIPWTSRVAIRLLGRKSDAPAELEGNANPKRDVSPETTVSSERLAEVIIEDKALQREATESRKGGFKPSKYDYNTFNNIRERTIHYCYSEQDEINIGALITECAEVLRKQSLKRRNLKGANVRSWENFRKDPRPAQSGGPSNEVPAEASSHTGGTQ
ncbi:FabD/lysophospholipase-like protein [Xylaria scruposa]|nr:FabD/lysophospholipase-like protein [Xylaria scruposa]